MGVGQIHPRESVALDFDLLDQMCARIGYTKAEAAISAAMEDLAVLLQYAGTLLKSGELTTLKVTSRQIEAISKRIGMCSLSRVASDVGRLCHSGDDPALAASVARLRRLGEQSLIAIWDRQDLSI